MSVDMRVQAAGLALKNPVIAGSGEATLDADGLRQALDAGVGAVVAKSTNESAAAKQMLQAAEYMLLDEYWRPLPWGPAPRGASLFCRSGLAPEPFERWVDILVEADRYAKTCDAYVVASLIVADPAETVRMARQIEQAGLRWLELNLGPPHGEEAPAGAIRTESHSEQVAVLVRDVRQAISIPLTVKLAGQGNLLPPTEAARDAGADAVCLAGRHLAFVPDIQTRRPLLGTFGAIGGAWALPLTLRWIAKARARLGPAFSLLGTNGARDGLDVIRFLLAGASAVEMTSAYITDGPGVLAQTIEEIAGYFDEQHVTAAEIIGEAADHVMRYEEAARAREA